MRLNKQDSEYALGPNYSKILNIAKFWICKVLNMKALHSILEIQEYALTEFWIYLEF